MTLKAFHNDPAVKEKYINRVQAHIAADNLIRGIGWDNGKGCAVGCTLEAYNHSRYPIELGIPEWLARVEDTLFEGMSVEKSRTWPLKFLDAIKVGADLEKIKPLFLVMVLESALETFDHEEFPDVKNAIQGSIDLWKRNDIGSQDFLDAARAAARAAAWAAARAAVRAEAAAAAWAEAWSAARSAAAWSAAKYDYFADELLKMLKDCK